jgi:hypothetical protein
VSKYEDYKHAEKHVGEMILNIEGSWLKTEMQLEVIRSLWDTLDGRIQIHFTKVLQHLQGKLQTALTKLSTVTGSAKDEVVSMAKLNLEDVTVKKWKMVFVKDGIDEAIRDLEEWQKRLDPSWYLITRIADPRIDRALEDNRSDPTDKLRELREAVRGGDVADSKRSIFMDGGRLIPKRRKISHSSVYVSIYRQSREAALIDRTNYLPDSNRATIMTYVRDLARLLSKVDPGTFGLLRCHGVIQVPDKNQFDFVFGIPPAVQNPRSLRDHLLVGTPHALDERIRLAKQLVRSVMFVHTAGFVHKNIRPETIIIFESGDCALGTSYWWALKGSASRWAEL